MKRQELAEKVNDLQDFCIVPPEYYDSMNAKRPERLRNRATSKSYNAAVDTRWQGYFDSLLSHYGKNRKSARKSKEQLQVEGYYLYVAFSIIANMSIHTLDTPSNQQMIEMLNISGYSAANMESFIREKHGLMPFYVPLQSQIPMVFLLTRMLFDTMCEPREASKLQALVAYMKKENLLSYMGEWLYSGTRDEEENNQGKPEPNGEKGLSTDNIKIAEDAEYEDFILQLARILLKRRALVSEVDDAFKAFQKVMGRIISSRDHEFDRAMQNDKRKRRNDGKTVNASFNPLIANPMGNPLICNPLMSQMLVPSIPRTGQFEPFDIVSMAIRDPKSFLARGFSVTDLTEEQRRRVGDALVSMLPPEARDVLKKHDEQIESISSAFERIEDIADGLQDTLDKERNEVLSEAYYPAIAEGAFRAILSGDDMYNTMLGRYIWQEFMMSSSIPVPLRDFGALEDEDQWGYDAPEANGRLASKVYDEGEMMHVIMEDGSESESLLLPAVISRYAEVPVKPSLYVRKSLIKSFKDAGFSERRARDFAVVIATLQDQDYKYGDFYVGGDNSCGDSSSGDSSCGDSSCGNIIGGDNPGCDNGTENGTKNRVEAGRNASTGKKTESDNHAEAVAEAKAELKKAKQESQLCRHEIGKLRRENDALKAEIERLRAMQVKVGTLEGAALDSAVEDVQEEISYPFHTNKRIVLYGGHEVFHRELEKYIPGVRVVEMAAHIDLDAIRKADIVFIQINKTSHSNYWSVRDGCKAAGIPCHHLNYASAKRCAAEMVERIKKLDE